MWNKRDNLSGYAAKNAVLFVQCESDSVTGVFETWLVGEEKIYKSDLSD